MKKKNLYNIFYIFFLLLINYSLNSQVNNSLLKNELQISTPSINVTIGGAFIINGTFSASPNERVDQFITRIYNQVKQEQQKLLLEKKKFDSKNLIELNQEDKFSMRNITLKRYNGEVIKIDLEKFRLTGNFDFNPYLKNDDILIFSPVDIERNFITISGAVNNPLKIEFIEGDRLSDLLLFAQGLNPAYENINKIEITRLNHDGTENEIILTDLNPEMKLKRADRIRVLADETQKKDFRVYIAGEVYKPGYINIPKQGIPLKDVIKQAGGFKNTADLNRAELIRGTNVFKSIFFSEDLDFYLMSRMANIKSEDSLTFLIDNKLRFLRGSGLIDFNKLNDENSLESDFFVKDGDYIFIPEKTELVYVFGQVKNFGFINYLSGKDYKYYIEKAGGLGEEAKDEIYLIKGKTRTWIMIKEQNAEIEPGDYLWVPKKYPKDFDYYVKTVGFIGSIVTAVATTLLLFVQAFK